MNKGSKWGESTSSFVFTLKREHIDIRRVRRTRSAWMSKLSTITDWDEVSISCQHLPCYKGNKLLRYRLIHRLDVLHCGWNRNVFTDVMC
jgi:hypothetical protein